MQELNSFILESKSFTIAAINAFLQLPRMKAKNHLTTDHQIKRNKDEKVSHQWPSNQEKQEHQNV